MVPLAENTALGIAIMSYNGQLNFGLTRRLTTRWPMSRRWPTSCGPSIEELVGGRPGRRIGATAARRVPRRRAVPRTRRVKTRRRRARARRDRARFAGALDRADRAAVGLLRRPRPGRRVAGPVSRSGEAVPRPRPRPCSGPVSPGPAYDSNPPTSGAHVPVPVTRDQAQLTDDQLLQALQVGRRRDPVRRAAGHRPA